MENLKERMVEFFLTFCMATTGGVFICAVYDSIFWRDALLNREVMWQIPLISFVCTLGSFIRPYREISKRRAVFYKILQYLYINVVILGGSYMLNALYIENVFMLTVFLFAILIVYAAMYYVNWELHKRESKRLNQKLLEYQSACGRTEGMEAEADRSKMEAESNFTVDKP